MAPKKGRFTSKKRAANHGGGRRQAKWVAEVPAAPAKAAASDASGSDSDISELLDNTSKAAKMSAGASPRSSTPRPTTPDPAVLTDDIEKQLRKARKVLRNIDDMMAKPVRALNGDQKDKILRRDEVAREVHQLEASLAALLPPPADEDGDEDEDGAAGEAAADVRGQEGGERAAMSYYRERGYGGGSSCSSGNCSRERGSSDCSFSSGHEWQSLTVLREAAAARADARAATSSPERGGGWCVISGCAGARSAGGPSLVASQARAAAAACARSCGPGSDGRLFARLGVAQLVGGQGSAVGARRSRALSASPTGDFGATSSRVARMQSCWMSERARYVGCSYVCIVACRVRHEMPVACTLTRPRALVT